MAVKRKLPVNGTYADETETHQRTTSPAPLSSKDHPAQSSKKARSKPPPPKTDAASEDEVAPLNDIPDNRGQLEYTSQVLDLAAAAWKESGFEECIDDDDDDDVHVDTSQQSDTWNREALGNESSDVHIMRWVYTGAQSFVDTR